MFENDTNADETVSRRSVLKTTGGLIAGSTALAGLGAGRGAAETEEGLQMEIQEMTEEYIAVEVYFPDDTSGNSISSKGNVFLGHAERFVIHEGGEWVSLPEDTEPLANPVEMDFENPHQAMMYFRTSEVDLSAASDDEVMLGLGVFPERTIPVEDYGACPGHRDY